MSAGAGAMAFAAACMRQTQNRMNNYMAERAAWRAARFSTSGRVRIDAPPPDRAEFECFTSCQECGFIGSARQRGPLFRGRYRRDQSRGLTFREHRQGN